MERTAQPKPLKGTAKRAKARGKRREGVVAKSVRQQCVIRDWHCIFMHRRGDLVGGWAEVGLCGGPSEWAHIGTHRRCHTRGMAPEARHTTQGSAMLCQRHHQALDAHEFDIEPQTAAGMDGPFAVVRRAA